MTREDIGRTLSELRKRAGMSREDVAEILDKSPKTIGHWETGHAMPDANMLFILCKIYDADLNDAFGFTPKGKKSPDPDDSEPRDENEREIISYLRRLLPQQQVFLLALLKTIDGLNQKTQSSVHSSSDDRIPVSEIPNRA